MRLLLGAACAMLLLAGCGGPSLGPTTYGSGGGLDGFVVLRALIAEHQRLGIFAGYGDRLDEARRLVFVQTDSTPPDQPFWQWLDGWLSTGEDRDALIVLRDVGTIDIHLQRWRDEATAVATQSREPRRTQEFLILAETLERFGQRYAPTAPLRPGATRALGPLALEGVPLRRPMMLHYREQELTVPQTMRVGQVLKDYDPEQTWRVPEFPWDIEDSSPPRALRVHDDGKGDDDDDDDDDDDGEYNDGYWEPLFTSEDGTLGGRYTYHAGGSVLVLSGASALTDGALVDPAARAFAAALLRELPPLQRRQRVAWLLQAQADAEAMLHLPGPLAALRHPAVLVVALHALVLLLIALASRALWVGRRRDGGDEAVVGFDRHLASVAHLLDDDQGRRQAVRSLAQWFRRSPGDALNASEQRQREVVATWYPQSSPTPSSTTDSQPAETQP